jgi:membrane protein implicated in regulation of membrane protease activity
MGIWLAWLIAGLVLVGIEVHTQAFFAIFLAMGAFAATVAVAAGLPVALSIAVFAAVALGGTVLVRPTLKRMSDRHIGPRLALPGSSDGLVGQRALTVDDIGDEHHPGHARLAGERWLAITDEPGGVQADTQVMVIDVRGTTLVVVPMHGA